MKKIQIIKNSVEDTVKLIKIEERGLNIDSEDEENEKVIEFIDAPEFNDQEEEKGFIVYVRTLEHFARYEIEVVPLLTIE